MDIFAELLNAFSPGREGFVFMWILCAIALIALVISIERWIAINRCTNIDAELFIGKLRELIGGGNATEALALCRRGGSLMAARVLGAGIEKSLHTPQMIRNAMEEESLGAIPRLERRTDLILMFGNVSTLLGLMGTIYGLILSFAAVARPDIDPILKSSALAQGISTAMNTTLLGLMISVPCVFLYSVLRAKIDRSVKELDRYAIALLKILNPADVAQSSYRVSGKRLKEEVDTEPNIAPMMNLMVILIPLLLSSAEFVKIGAIELKLPQSAGGHGGTDTDEQKRMQNARLDLGVVVTADGFDLLHYFRHDSLGAGPKAETPLIPLLEDGTYDYAALNGRLAEVKRQALHGILSIAHPGIPADATLLKLFKTWSKSDYGAVKAFADHEEIKIVAQDSISYQVVVSVMDAARGAGSPYGNVTMFPNVSLAGGIIK